MRLRDPYGIKSDAPVAEGSGIGSYAGYHGSSFPVLTVAGAKSVLDKYMAPMS